MKVDWLRHEGLKEDKETKKGFFGFEKKKNKNEWTNKVGLWVFGRCCVCVGELMIEELIN